MADELSPDEIRTAVRGYFSDGVNGDGLRAACDGAASGRGPGFDMADWKVLARQIGLAALGAPESWGGLDCGAEHVAAAMDECGAALYPGPARSAMLLASALHGVDRARTDPVLVDAVERVLNGDAVPGAVTSLGSVDPPPAYDGGVVTGTVRGVLAGAAADIVLCRVRAGERVRPALVLTDASAFRTRLRSIDASTPLADITVDCAPAVIVGGSGAADAEPHLRAAHRMLAAAEQVGGAEGCLAAMVEYAKVRTQFGAVIGSYQAIQHRCARTAVSVASARSLVTAAARALGRDEPGAAEQLSLLARAEAGECFLDAADGLIQVCGGIGFTWEHDAHLYYRRARTSAVIDGTPDDHRRSAVEAGCAGLLTAAAL